MIYVLFGILWFIVVCLALDVPEEIAEYLHFRKLGRGCITDGSDPTPQGDTE